MRFLISAAFLLVACSAIFSQAKGPKEVATEFYSFNDSRSSTFNKSHIESRKAWYTSELYRAFTKQLMEDRAYLRKNPTDKPYFGDGLDFKPLNEPCSINGKNRWRSRSIGRPSIRGQRATVPVNFAYPKGCSVEPTIYKIELQKVGGQWRIADLRYDDNSGLLSDMKQHGYLD